MFVVSIFQQQDTACTILSSDFLSFLGGLTFSSLILFYLKFEFGFAEGARVVLDWTEETEIEEVFGYFIKFSCSIASLSFFFFLLTCFLIKLPAFR